jgi:hypothetical protein
MTIKLWSLIGNSQKLDGGAMFGNVPRAMWSKWVEVDEDNRIDLACRACWPRASTASGCCSRPASAPSSSPS